jgi:hypothetical protein
MYILFFFSNLPRRIKATITAAAQNIHVRAGLRARPKNKVLKTLNKYATPVPGHHIHIGRAVFYCFHALMKKSSQTK